MSATLRVVMASDHRYFIGLLVSATSVAWWLPASTTLELHVLDDGILESQFRTLTRRLRTIQPSSRIVRHPVQELDLQRYSASHTYPATAVARLFIPTLIPTNDPILYLDVDTVCLGDLSHLATLPLGDHVMAACTEVVGQSCLADDCPFELSSEADRQAPYFNTGVLLLNPAAWREQQISEQALTQLARSDAQFRYADQTVLNYIARHKIERLHDHHNTLHSLFASDQEIWPKILHFYGGTKPWHCFEPQSDAWLAWYISSQRIAAVKIHQHSSLLWRPLLANRLRYPSHQRQPVISILTTAIASKRQASGDPPPAASLDQRCVTRQSRQPNMALKSILNSPLFYKVFHPVLSAAAKINNHIEIQKSYRQHLEFKSYSERIAGILSPSKCVLSGPFQGLHYPSFQASGSALIPKILGVYESELHPDIEALRGSYDCILDIGCAEGYYAIGLARMHPGATVHAYDIDPDAARKTIEMAALNNVSNRLEIHGGASWRDLLTVSNQKALIVCDCEGHERLLFSHQNISYLANSDLIIELHPFVCEDVTTYLLSLFAPSHACKLVTAIPDQDKNLELEPIQHLPLADKKLCVAEFRGNFQQWLICRHHSGSL